MLVALVILVSLTVALVVPPLLFRPMRKMTGGYFASGSKVLRRARAVAMRARTAGNTAEQRRAFS